MNRILLKKAELTLRENDPVLGQLIKRQTLAPRPHRTDYFASLCRSIVGQQVSVAAASAIYGRLETATDLKPARVVELRDEEIKAIGLSRQKATYLKDLAAHFVKNPAVYNHLESQTDEQVIAELTAVKGIGTWTAQMFLMFTLARPDVFAPDDVGLQRAILQLYGWGSLPPKKELELFAQKWQPYRTVASLHLWQSLNNNPV